MRLVALLMACSVYGCAAKRPDIELMIINAPGEQREGYNLLRDYDDQGRIKAGAKPTIRPNRSLFDLNKMLCLDSERGPEIAIARFKAWVKELRENYEKGCPK